MSIATRCPSCGKIYQLADEQAGLRVRCRACGGEFDVPRSPELLEAVVELPGSRRMELADDPDAMPLALTAPPRRSRVLFWVLTGLGTCVVLVMLICAGVLYKLTVELRRTRDMAMKVLDQPAPTPEAPKPAPPPEKPPVPPPQAGNVQVPLPNLELQLGPKIKDLDDALAKLRSPDQLTRVLALAFIGKQKVPDDPAKRKQVLDAIEPLTKDESALVQIAASNVKITWGGFD